MMEAMCFSETSGRKKPQGVTKPVDGILRGRRRQNLKSYIALTGWAL
jgi:hypothetical protein